MPRFVSLPDRDGPAGSARMWINPKHIVSLVPKVHRDGTHHILRVEIKLVGMPAFDAWLGKFDSGSDADARGGSSWAASGIRRCARASPSLLT